MSAYNEYLLSAHWKNLKAQVFLLAGNKCEACYRDDVPRVGHHLLYRNPLESCTRADVMCLCVHCHDMLHQWLDQKGLKSADLDRQQTKERCRILFRGFAKVKQPKVRKVLNLNIWNIEDAARDLAPNEIEHLKELLATKKQSGSDATWNWAIKKLSRAMARNLKHLRRSPRGEKARERLHGIAEKKILTPNLLDRLYTARGGYTRAELAALGVSWPPKKGWKKQVLANLAKAA